MKYLCPKCNMPFEYDPEDIDYCCRGCSKDGLIWITTLTDNPQIDWEWYIGGDKDILANGDIWFQRIVANPYMELHYLGVSV